MQTAIYIHVCSLGSTNRNGFVLIASINTPSRIRDIYVDLFTMTIMSKYLSIQLIINSINKSTREEG